MTESTHQPKPGSKTPRKRLRNDFSSSTYKTKDFAKTVVVESHGDHHPNLERKPSLVWN